MIKRTCMLYKEEVKIEEGDTSIKKVKIGQEKQDLFLVHMLSTRNKPITPFIHISAELEGENIQFGKGNAISKIKKIRAGYD